MGFLSGLKDRLTPTPVDYSEKIKNGAVIVDVRTPMEFQSGHVKGSKNIPVNNIGSAVNQLKGKEVILVCMSGGRASSAKAVLERAGITAHNAGAWQNLLGK